MGIVRGVLGCFFVLCILYIPSLCQAKSVFAIASHANGKIKAYSVDPNSSLTFQTTIKDTENFGAGAGGLCLWPEKDRMFVNYETPGIITWASIKNLSRNPETDEVDTGMGMPGGMIVDEQLSRLYVILRGGNKLYAFDYYEEANTLVPIPLDQTNNYVVLDGIGESEGSGGIDIDFDPEGSSIMGISVGRLYASDMTKTIRYYNTATWQLESSFELQYNAVGIGLDKTNQYLYAGEFTGGSGHSYLMRYTVGGDPNDSETHLKKDVGAPIMDIAVDQETGFIYLTLKRESGGRTGIVEVYNPTNWISTDPDSLVLLDSESDGDFVSQGPGGIAIGPSYKPVHDMFIMKVDDVADPNGCVVPGNTYHYDITYRPGPADEANVVIIDKLPEGVDFVSADPNWGEYFSQPDHKYVWELGGVDGYDPNTWMGGDPNYYFELTVQVNDYAEPLGTLYNKVSAESDLSFVDMDETTRVGCWGGNVIYVDRYAPGPNIGTTWETAYLNLTDAFARAELDCGSVIRVADGTYKPGTETGDAFEIPDDVEVSGGYSGYGAADPNERDWKRYKTILSGLISGTSRNNTVVKMGDNSLLDGVTVEEGGYYGIFGDGDDFSIMNCLVKNNNQKGVYCNNGYLIVKWCSITDNGQQGIHHLGSNYLLTVENCKIHNNQYDGVRTVSSAFTMLNSKIYQNGSGTTYYGLNLNSPSSCPTLRNNTIVDNINEGIRFVGSNTPDIRNCIVYYNGGNSQLAGLDPDTDADYCCIQDCNEIPTNSNFNDTPDFVYDFEPYGYYHIKYESPCRNAGDNTYVGQDEADMDDEIRTQETIVDIGADEVACEDTWHEDDWTYDGVINMEEFSIFSVAWLSHDPNDPVCHPNHQDYVSDPNDPDYISQAAKDNWNPICNLEVSGSSEYAIDLGDLASFCDNWLWEACWRENYVAVMYGMSGGGGESMMMAAPPLMSTLAVYKTQPVPEKSIAGQVLDLEDCIKLLEKIWMEDPYIQQEIDSYVWKEFMDAVYDGLDLLQMGSVPMDIEQ